MRGYLPKIGIITVITLFLTACGGGGSGGFSTGSSTGEPAAAPSMTLSILDSNGAATTQVNGDIPITIRAVLVDDSGDAVVDAVVKFTSTIGQLTPATGNVLTLAGGIAEIQLGAGTVPDAGTITATATVNAVNVTASTTVQSDGLSTAGDDEDTVIVLELTFTDSTPGNSSNIITNVDNATVGILVTDFFGFALSNRTATVTTSLGTVSVVGGTAAPSITAASDSEGRISVTLTAGAVLGTGDFTVVVEDVTEILQFDVVIGGLKIGTGTGASFVEGVMDIGLTPLSAGGTSSVSVTVVDSSNVAVPGIEIEFSSNCSTKASPEASISALVTSNTLGIAEATYEASGCEGPDIITATESSSGNTATGTIEVFPPAIGSIVFDSVTDALGNGIETISFKDSGGISTAKVIFQVLDVLGDPVKDKLVAFELSTTVGGIELQNSSALTDDQGKAVAVVNAGFVQTTLKVKASIS
ncbi:MAG TPA: hypothetical protein EYG51_14445, partial [Pseudomonadales bacterium]|nr:hypothetical protein [Pseudomonadales bacterium]